MAAASKEEYLLVFIALLNTVISLFYYLLIVKAMFINERESGAVERFSIDNYNKASIFICTIGILVVGILSCIYQSMGALSFGI
jgi:NADH-quinone oxidoreductase subunit N